MVRVVARAGDGLEEADARRGKEGFAAVGEDGEADADGYDVETGPGAA